MDVNQLFLDHQKWLYDLAFRNIGRLTQVSYPIDVDELYSIFCEVFMDCVSGRWNQEKGKLTTYLFHACRNKVSDMIDKHFHMEIHTKKESEMVRIDEDGSERNGLESIAGSADDLAIDEYLLMEALSKEAENLSPFARLLLEYTLNPPDFIERELLAQEAKHDLSLTMDGVSTYRRHFLSLSFVAKCMTKTMEQQITRSQVVRAMNEVKSAVIAVAA